MGYFTTKIERPFLLKKLRKTAKTEILVNFYFAVIRAVFAVFCLCPVATRRWLACRDYLHFWPSRYCIWCVFIALRTCGLSTQSTHSRYFFFVSRRLYRAIMGLPNLQSAKASRYYSVKLFSSFSVFRNFLVGFPNFLMLPS